MKSKFHLFTLSLFYLLLLTATLPLSAEDELNPVADPAAVVTSGNARFTVLTSQMIRIQYSSAAQFEDRATFAIVNRHLPVPEFTTETSDGYLYIHTNDLTLRYKEGSVFSPTDKKPDNLMVTFQLNGRNVTWYPGKDDSMNLLGTNRTLDTAWGDNAATNWRKAASPVPDGASSTSLLSRFEVMEAPLMHLNPRKTALRGGQILSM